MNRPPQGRGQPRLGATWYPGGQDDFYMPEVISPSPQRVMPEVPENMQDNLAHLEHQARGPHRGQHAPVQYDRNRFPERTSSVAVAQGPPLSAGYDVAHHEQAAVYDISDGPNLSPFPVLRNPPPNVPPTDEQREASLERARVAVLSSNDPEMQLAWAQDALAYVEVAVQNEARLSLIQPPRPQTPPVERQLKVDAMNIVNFLADQHHPKADFIRGMWLEFGKFGYRVDKKAAFHAYSRAAAGGYARAEYRIGMQFESSGEPEKAIRHYEKGVALADSASYYRLGMMILLGQHGQRQDYQTGLDYISLAAQSCDENAPQGAYVYGMLLARELPQVNVPETYLPLDLNAARVNIEKAAYHGFAKAQVKIGAAYELGQLDCDFNPALSLHYNALAARQGEPEAEMAISKWFLCGHEGVFEKNDKLAFTFAHRAALSGFPTAEFALGYFYEVGIYVDVDLKEARSWYAKAAASGNKDATSRIDSISRSKTLSRKDHENVAIARIKSRYGSHQRGNSLEPMQETLEMPDPSRMSLADNGPSGAPYPDRVGSRSRPAYPQGYQAADPRPSSAFGINPNIRTNAPNYNRAASYGPGPANFRNPGPGAPSTVGPTSPVNAHSPSTTPKLDIGYSAPMDPSIPDPRRRPQRHDGMPPDRKPIRTPVSPHSQGSSAGSPRPMGSPPAASFPQSSRTSTPKPSGPPAGSASQKPTAQAPTKPSPGGLPGKGPKTFEEMGVPTVQKDSDCIIM
ncbi:putative chitin synthase activator (Chs3) [Aspergillus clavatus NRRL 1]|uniref:Chitin synthase activator (Chs3), putative n=1 Tax=Aspergillus clavatus (strain ATCC 1007 / CBS 513.65 / DSM 816 / NCTC 3887 / NRRL 1 / QM 1276 / 107) TaxID=344612 RepID=A1CJ33_ASPCL|nr:chitin synthase activator (Chs3), putative [Aspergillus clavatus NRRL 1]EAW09157.1 chitin synthase activator (Chs3), putative [Aspergillus clavatus NRRL 1]